MRDMCEWQMPFVGREGSQLPKEGTGLPATVFSNDLWGIAGSQDIQLPKM